MAEETENSESASVSSGEAAEAKVSDRLVWELTVKVAAEVARTDSFCVCESHIEYRQERRLGCDATTRRAWTISDDIRFADVKKFQKKRPTNPTPYAMHSSTEILTEKGIEGLL